MQIYVVRHGETRANVDGFLQGWSNDALNDQGVALAELTGKGMKGLQFDVCISSPLLRAKQTAEIILRQSGNKTPIRYDDRIKEINFGDYELAKVRAPEIELFFKDPFRCPQFPNGENIQMVIERTQRFLLDIISNNAPEKYLIVTHGCALRAMLNAFYDDPSDFWHGHVPYNCSVNIVEARNGRGKLTVEDRVYYEQKDCIDHYALAK